MKRNSMTSRAGGLALMVGLTTLDAARAPTNRLSVRTGDSTSVVLLGTGGPAPDPTASGPATAVVVGSRVFLFDAGAGVVRRMAAAHLPVNGVTALFITHLHSDHTLGYPDLILTTWVAGRTAPLEAFGPPGLREMTDHLLAAWQQDEEMRINSREHEARARLAVHVHEIA